MTNNEGSNELLPCPFCGGKAAIGNQERGRHCFVHCVECLAATNLLIPHMNTKEIAVELWNTRAALERTQVEELIKVLKNIKLQTEFFTQDGIGENVAMSTLKIIDMIVDNALERIEEKQNDQ